MTELVQVTERCHYFSGPVKVGLVRLEGDEVCLIDSGNDKSAGKAVRKALQEHGFHLKAIYLTHAHADHSGGCRYLQTQTGCRVYAPGAECAVACHPLLEPSLLYGGYPYRELRGKFLMAAACEAEPLCTEALPSGWEMIPLPGHFLDMVGFRTPDDVVYVADSLSSRETLEKYRICYTYDVAATLRTLEMLQGMQARLFIPAHAEPTADIAPLARYNEEQIRALAELILQLCAAPRSFEELLQSVADACGLVLNDEQYVLIGSTLRSYLSWLRESGRVQTRFEANRMLWSAAAM